MSAPLAIYKDDQGKLARPRSLDQNARMWAMLTDLSKQLQWPVDGELCWMTPKEWKVVISAGLRQQRVAKGIERSFVFLDGMSTSQMKIAEMSKLIDLMFMFGALHDIAWTDPTIPPDETLAEELVRRPVR